MNLADEGVAYFSKEKEIKVYLARRVKFIVKEFDDEHYELWDESINKKVIVIDKETADRIKQNPNFLKSHPMTFQD